MPGAMPVILLLVWSKLNRAEYCRSRFSISGTFSENSHVPLSIWPAFFHWFEKPDDADGGTWSSSLVTMPCACVTVSVLMLNIWYCCEKLGRLPAWPMAARSLKSLIAFLKGQNGSSDVRHANDPRPPVV